MSAINKLSLGKKLVLVFVTIVIISTVGNIIVMYEVGKMSEDTNKLGVVIVQSGAVRELGIGVYTALASLWRWQSPLLDQQTYDQQFESLEESRAKCLGSVATYRQGHIYSVEEEQVLQQTEKYIAEYDAAVLGMIEIAHQLRDMQDRTQRAMRIAQRLIDLDLFRIRAQLSESMYKLVDLLDHEKDVLLQESADNARITTMITIFVSIFVAIFSLAMGFFLSMSITRRVSALSKTLVMNSESITASSKELATGSQALASGASEQAASVEEISASIEEISSMVKQNADNASQASKLANAAGAAIDATQKAMKRSMAASEEIARASGETSKIIKTIDEIAFQTNLLSLNAAVEAARAGEAGAGFAVVADEVRGLSIRSAEASKRTAELIEQTIAKVKEGMEIFAETNKDIDEVVTHAANVQQLVDEVSAASDEQSKGLDEINRGTTEMEKVIQQNAANAEESAASTEELNGQAEEMVTAMGKFQEYIFGEKWSARDFEAAHAHRQPKKKQPAAVSKPKPSAPPLRKAAPAAAAAAPAKAAPVHAARHNKKEVKPEEVLPLDDDDMHDF